MPPSPKIVQLRQLLSERFPGARFSAEPQAQPDPAWPTGVAQIDSLLRGGPPKGAITELVAAKSSSGSALLMAALLRNIAEKNEILALVDAQDSFDPSGFSQQTLARLLWVRCKNADQALKAVDLILRDRNLPIVLLDLALNSAQQLRKIPSSTWYRLQRIIEQSSTVFLVVAPQSIVSCAQARLVMNNRFALEDLERDQEQLLAKLQPELAQHRLQIQPNALKEKTA